ncbi:hypothetical protein ANN_06842 [Periplaneta americana]|uniref:PHD-type domain-containing protein n=1 Tax=Periplaneta americana TaxID=6978 RepID=A0ABQ8TFI2_PERAM|nr:hypothetical protein ANN_06842 [Periplaneta americana]
MSRCYECSKAITKRDDSVKIQCSECKNWFHDKCIPLNKTDTDIFHAKNEVWVCKYCAGQKKESSPIELHTNVPSILDIYNLLKRIETEFANKYSTLERINKETEQELGKSLDLVHEKLDENSRLIKQQAESIKTCLESIDGLKKENMLLKNNIEETKAQLDDLEQYGRRNSIEIHGIPEMANENLLEIVKNIGCAMDMEIQPQMIDSCHRLGKSPGQPSAAVIVKFVRRMDKDQFIHRRKVKRNRKASQIIYVGEMTLYCASIYYERITTDLTSLEGATFDRVQASDLTPMQHSGFHATNKTNSSQGGKALSYTTVGTNGSRNINNACLSPLPPKKTHMVFSSVRNPRHSCLQHYALTAMLLRALENWLFNDAVSTTIDEIGDSEMVFGEMRPRIRHRLPGIHLTAEENLGKTQPGDNVDAMSPGSSTKSYPAFAHTGLRENPGKNLNQVTCPDRESNPGHLVSRPDAQTVTTQQRANIKVCYKFGKAATETHGMLVQVYGREAVSRKCVYEWFKRFLEGKETIEDEPRSGRPSTSRTPEMIEKVRQMLAQDRRLSLELIAEELDISKDTMHTIVRDDLGKRKICSRFVPHKLTDEQKAKRMETSRDFISMCDEDPLPLKTIVTGDETWCYQFDPESKRQWMSWCSPTSPQPKKKSRLQKSKVKTLLIAFFDNNGIIHKEFVPAAYPAGSARVAQTGKWMLLCDNAPAHCGIRERQFLAQKMVTVLEHPPYSPDLAAFKRVNRKKSAGARSGDFWKLSAKASCGIDRRTAVTRSLMAFTSAKLSLFMPPSSGEEVRRSQLRGVRSVFKNSYHLLSQELALTDRTVCRGIVMEQHPFSSLCNSGRTRRIRCSNRFKTDW